MGKPKTLRKRREQLHEADLMTDLLDERGDSEDERQDGQGQDADDV